MRKLLLFCVALLFTGTTLLGQTTLLTEGWETATLNSNVPPTGWGLDIVLGSNITYYMSQGTWPTIAPFEGSRLVDFESFSYSSATNRLKRTTAISTVGYTNITVDFEWYTDNGYSGTSSEGVTVQWSTDGVNWTNSTFFQRYNATNQWVLETVSLPAGAAGQATFYVAFYFNSNYGDDCHMDIMHVKGTIAPLPLPFTEDFETAAVGQVPPTNWGVDLVSGSNYTYFQSAGTWPTCTPYSGSRMVEFQSFNAGSGTENRLKMTTPVTTVGYSTVNMDFRWLTDPGYSSSLDRVNVQWSTNGTSWTTIATFNRYAATQQWTLQSLTLPAGAGNQPTLYIAFDFISAYGNNCHMDLVHITAAVPVVVTTAATSIATTSATLNGTVNPNGYSSTVNFDYGLTTSYGSNVAGTPSPVTGTSPVAVSANILGLATGTLYHYRVNATNSNGTSNGNDMTFTTLTPPPPPPTVVTLAATGVAGTSATMNGTINPNGGSTNSSFDYGLTIPYAFSVAGVPATLTGNTAQAVSASLTGLTNNSVYHFRVKGTNAGGTSFGNDLTFIIGCPVAGAAGAISGPISVCQGGCGYVYTVPVIQGATGYIWTIPVGGTITSGANTNSITVCYAPNANPGYVFVYGTAPCGNGSPSQLGVAMNAPATPTIAGPASVCVNSTGNTYTTQAGMSGYTWTVSAGGTITAGGGTGNNTITITWNTVGAQTVSVNYNNANGCAGLSAAVYNVTVNALPVPTISGPATGCTTVPAVYSTQTGMTSYTWSTSSGGSITSGLGTSSITVLWNTAGAQSVSVNYTSAAGCTATSPTNYPVTVNTTTVPVITGPTSVCANSGYSTYTTQTGMTAYNWTISSGGTISYGAGTASVSVTWTTPGAQWIRVTFMNPSGCSPASPTQMNVTVSTIPGAAGSITGTSTVCAGAQGVAYSVGTITNAVAYVWTLPTGATIATGANTNNITVNFGANAVSGNITVYGNNTCGNGTVSPAFPVTVNPLPDAAGTITGPASLCVGATGEVYTVPAINNATGYTWTVPAGAIITGGANTNSITVDFSANAVSGNITVLGTNSCGNGTVSPNFAVTVNPIPPAPVVTNTGTTLQSSAATGNQWYFEGTLLTGATGQTYVATQDGYYWDVVTLNGCSSDTSNHKLILTTGIDPYSAASINIYPVPNDGQFNVSITTTSEQTFSISVYNSLGVKIYEETKVDVNGSLQKVIDLRPVPNGIYTVIFENSVNQVVKKIVVSK